MNIQNVKCTKTTSEYVLRIYGKKLTLTREINERVQIIFREKQVTLAQS